MKNKAEQREEKERLRELPIDEFVIERLKTFKEPSKGGRRLPYIAFVFMARDVRNEREFPHLFVLDCSSPPSLEQVSDYVSRKKMCRIVRFWLPGTDEELQRALRISSSETLLSSNDGAAAYNEVRNYVETMLAAGEYKAQMLAQTKAASPLEVKVEEEKKRIAKKKATNE